MIIDFYGNGGGSGGVTSGEVENMISSALTDYYTSGETDTAIDDAVDAIDFDTLEAVPDFPSAATQGDVVAKVTEGEPMLSWTFPGEYSFIDITSATVTNTFNWNDFPMNTPYTIASWTSVQNHQMEVVAKRRTETQNGATWEEISLYLYADGEEVKQGTIDPENIGADDLTIDYGIDEEVAYFPDGGFKTIYFGADSGNTSEEKQFVVFAEYGEEYEWYAESLVPILGLQSFGPAGEDTMGVYQYDGTNWNAVGGGAGGNANIVELTQAEYDALVNKDEDAIYVITDAQAIDLGDYAMNSAVTASLATKADAQNISANTATTSSYLFPTWNEQGVITGRKSNEVWYRTFNINGQSYRVITTTATSGLPSIYTPTSGGTAGQVLQSNGNNTAPVWANFTSFTNGISFWKGTQAEYDAITTKDASTLYIITD